MLYIIMCGGDYGNWPKPRQLTEINGEAIVARTIRLLKQFGVADIAISSNHSAFEAFGVPVLKHENGYITDGINIIGGHWNGAFYPTDVPVCYIFGDVVFSPEAIKTIVETETDDIELFASCPPFADTYKKPYAEPFALKVTNIEHLRKAIASTTVFEQQHMFVRKPIMWELWQVIKETPLNEIDYSNYTAINDYTCDVDSPADVRIFENII